MATDQKEGEREREREREKKREREASGRLCRDLIHTATDAVWRFP
jgi:hypothetical protein